MGDWLRDVAKAVGSVIWLMTPLVIGFLLFMTAYAHLDRFIHHLVGGT